MKAILLLATTLAALALPLGAAAQGQTVWRCGADGRNYSATPCTDGHMVAGADARPAADVKAAQDVAQRERQLGQRLAQERQQRDVAAGPNAGLAGIGSRSAQAVKPATAPKRPLQTAKHPKVSLPEADGIWQAVAPVSRRKKG
jgi:hypothetical protein